MSKIALATVDIEPFIRGSRADRHSVGQAFARALETAGFAVVVGHGVPESLAAETYGALKEFFGEPEDKKLVYSPPEQVKGRGYLPVGIESVAKTLSGEAPPDLCEALVFSAPHRDSAASANIWPEHPTRLRPAIAAWCRAICGLNAQLWQVSAAALDLPDDYFLPWVGDPALVLRFVHYPDQPLPPAPGQLRYGAHHDYGGLTILRQDTAPGGLEIRDREGHWQEAGVIPNSFVINVGDLLARWTNNRWPSTLHRVTNPGRALTGSTARLSMVAFAGPNEMSEVACLPTCCTPGNPAQHAPVNAGDYVRAKLAKSMDVAAVQSPEL